MKGMKRFLKNGVTLLLAAMMVLFLAGCKSDANDSEYKGNISLDRLRITGDNTALAASAIGANLGTPAATTAEVLAGRIPIGTNGEGEDGFVVHNPRFTLTTVPATGVTAVFAVAEKEQDPGEFEAALLKLSNGDVLWVKISRGKSVLYYKFNIIVGVQASSDYTDGFGVPDPEYMAKYPYMVFPNLEPGELLTQEKLPLPSYWNRLSTEQGLTGHIHIYPDPFHFANGNRVVNLKDWENRRKEIQLLISYYGKGLIPSIDSEVVDIWLTGDNNTTINVRHKESGRTESFTISVTDNAAFTVAGNEGKLYGWSGFGTSAADITLNIGNHASSVSAASLRTLYFGTATATTQGKNNITRDSATAWCAGVLLAAIEGTDDPAEEGGPRQAAKQYFYPISMVGSPTPGLEDQSWFTTKGPLYSTGYSTLGKQALAHVMGIGRNGSRFGHADIGDSGAGGAAIERFAAVAGFRLDITLGEALSYSGYSEADVRALGLDPDLKNPIKNSNDVAYGWPVPIAPKNHIGARTRSNGLGGTQDMWGVPYYTYGLQAGRTWSAGPGFPDIAGTGKGNLKMVRGWAPYYEEFDRVPERDNDFLGGNAGFADYRVPYIAWLTDNYGGIQQWMQGRGEDGTSRNWFGDVWRQFTDLHSGLNLDARREGGGGGEGFGCSMPFDTYFETMLNAPYGTNYIRAGVFQTRTNQPSMWANWLIVDEVYKFFGEQEYAEEFNNGVLVEDPAYPGSGLKMGWDKYLWRNLHFFNWGTHGGNTAEETSTSTAVLGLVRSGRATTAEARTNPTLAKTRDPAFSIDDPVYFLAEWCKFDWGRPGSPTIAERVRRRVEPTLKDYFMGEMYHEVPNAALDATTYNDAAKANYTPTGPKFRRMDWKGLTDNPERMD